MVWQQEVSSHILWVLNCMSSVISMKRMYKVSLKIYFLPSLKKIRCSSGLRASAHGAIGHWIDPLWWPHCAVLSVGWCILKNSLC